MRRVNNKADIKFSGQKRAGLSLVQTLAPLALSTCLAIATSTGTLAVEDDEAIVDNETKNLEQTKQQTNAELEALANQTTSVTETLVRLEENIKLLKADQDGFRKALKEAEDRQQELDNQIDAGEARLIDLQGDEEKLKASLRERNAVLAEVLAALQRLGSNPPPALLVSPEDALSSVRSAILLGAVVPEIRSETEKLIDDLQQLADVRKEITSEREQLAAAFKRSVEEEEELTFLLQENAALNVASLQQLEREREKAQELQSKSDDLKDAIATIDNEIVAIRKAREEARLAEIERQKRTEEQLERARKLADSMPTDDDLLGPLYAFSALKNTLQLPTNGTLAKAFGDDDAYGQPLDGILLAANTNAPVAAPVDGWIEFSGDFRSYGKIIIINAGEGYHMVLAGMDEINVSQGQFVLAGEPIASMGQDKLGNNSALALASDKPTLYIELRKNQKPIDSEPWWASIASGRVSNDT